MSKIELRGRIVIYPFMIEVLDLKGSELVAYAVIHGYTLANNDFWGSTTYLARWANTTRQNMTKILGRLKKKGLIIPLNTTRHKTIVYKPKYMYYDFENKKKAENKDENKKSETINTDDLNIIHKDFDGRFIGTTLKQEVNRIQDIDWENFGSNREEIIDTNLYNEEEIFDNSEAFKNDLTPSETETHNNTEGVEENAVSDEITSPEDETNETINDSKALKDNLSHSETETHNNTDGVEENAVSDEITSSEDETNETKEVNVIKKLFKTKAEEEYHYKLMRVKNSIMLLTQSQEVYDVFEPKNYPKEIIDGFLDKIMELSYDKNKQKKITLEDLTTKEGIYKIMNGGF